MQISVVFSIHCNIRYVVLSYDGIKTIINDEKDDDDDDDDDDG